MMDYDEYVGEFDCAKCYYRHRCKYRGTLDACPYVDGTESIDDEEVPFTNSIGAFLNVDPVFDPDVYGGPYDKT